MVGATGLALLLAGRGLPQGPLHTLTTVALVALIFASDAASQGKAEKDKVRIGYAARAVAHSVPYVAKEAGLFAEEGLDAEIIRTSGNIAPMASAAAPTNSRALVCGTIT